MCHKGLFRTLREAVQLQSHSRVAVTSGGHLAIQIKGVRLT